nr:hypothetical protein [Lactiplantibacillus plantarum]
MGGVIRVVAENVPAWLAVTRRTGIPLDGQLPQQWMGVNAMKGV